jgi:Terminase RNaseH-like domain
MFKLNKNTLIKTPTGFEIFSGIQKVYKPFYHWIIFDDETEIKCSENHSFGSEKIKASNIKVDDFLQGKKVVYNEIVEEGIYLYDLLDVGENNLYYSNNIISHNCEFLGSVDTLIAPSKLRSLVYDAPKTRSAGLDVHMDPIDEHDYLITVDVARGVGNDYSAFVIIDITEFPHKVVAKYRNNEIKPMIFPNIIYEVAKSYNDSYILCEVNDVGDQVASILQYDLEYNNILMCSMRGRAGQIVGQGFSGKKTQLGVKMSKTVKKIGCLNLKTMVEEDKLYLNDYEIMSELTTFIQKHNSFEAEEGCNDDLAMCLVIYAWLVSQDYFKELTDQDVRKRLYEEQKNQIDQDMAPFGFIDDGFGDSSFTDVEGDRWYVDEYGDRSYMWQYN